MRREKERANFQLNCSDFEHLETIRRTNALGSVARVVAIASVAFHRVLRGERRRIRVSNRAGVGREYSLCKPSAIADVDDRFGFLIACDFLA